MRKFGFLAFAAALFVALGASADIERNTNSYVRAGVTYAQRGGMDAKTYVVTNVDMTASDVGAVSRDETWESVSNKAMTAIQTLEPATNYTDEAVKRGMTAKDGAARELPPYLHYMSFDDVYPEDAEWYYEQAATNYVHGSCSARRVGGILERNYDWEFDRSPEFVVLMSGSDTRFASVGIANVGRLLTEDFVTSGKWSRHYRCLPGHTLDGVNENGVVAEINVVGGDPFGWRSTGDIHPLGAVRWALDNGTSAEMAASNLAVRVKFPSGWSQNFHYMIADAAQTWIVENGEAHLVGDASVSAVMTNFRLYPTHDTEGEGQERYAILSNPANAITDAWFTRCYKRETTPPWVSDLRDVLAYTNAIYDAWATHDREFFRDMEIEGKRWWQTVHSTRYDFNNRTLRVSVQETDEWYVFACPSVGKVKSVNAKTGDVVINAEDVGAISTTGGVVSGSLTFPFRTISPSNSRDLTISAQGFSLKSPDSPIRDGQTYSRLDSDGHFYAREVSAGNKVGTFGTNVKMTYDGFTIENSTGEHILKLPVKDGTIALEQELGGFRSVTNMLVYVVELADWHSSNIGLENPLRWNEANGRWEDVLEHGRFWLRYDGGGEWTVHIPDGEGVEFKYFGLGSDLELNGEFGRLWRDGIYGEPTPTDDRLATLADFAPVSNRIMNNSVYVGIGATASSNDGTAIGRFANAGGNAFAAGVGANSRAANSVAIGRQSVSTNDSAVSVGIHSMSHGPNTFNVAALVGNWYAGDVPLVEALQSRFVMTNVEEVVTNEPAMLAASVGGNVVTNTYKVYVPDGTGARIAYDDKSSLARMMTDAVTNHTDECESISTNICNLIKPHIEAVNVIAEHYDATLEALWKVYISDGDMKMSVKTNEDTTAFRSANSVLTDTTTAKKYRVGIDDGEMKFFTNDFGNPQ